MPRDWWNEQWYLYCPPAVNTKSKDPPAPTVPESHSDSGVSPVEVWLDVLSLVQWTVPPMSRAAVFGVNTKLVIDTLTVAAMAFP